jgi:hypothetical protein
MLEAFCPLFLAGALAAMAAAAGLRLWMWRPVELYIFVVGWVRQQFVVVIFHVVIPVSCDAGRVNTDTDVIVVSRRGRRRPSQRFVYWRGTHTAYDTSTYYFGLLAILKI